MTGTRRAVLGAGLALTGAAAASAKVAARPRGPVIVSTWDFGREANIAGLEKLKAGGTALDAVEAAGRVPEADPSNHFVGFAGYPDREGRVTLDACIMDDRLNLGSVAAVEDIMHVVSLARRVMEKTPHTMLVGEGARAFALAEGFPITRMPTPEAEAKYREWLKTSKYQPIANVENSKPPQPGSKDNHDTIGILALDAQGRLAGACTTSGMMFKMRGRVGDSPIAGAGLFVEPGVGAATSTGVGEEVMRIAGSARVCANMRMGMSPHAAIRETLMHIKRMRGSKLGDEQVGFLALDQRGRWAALALQPGFTAAITEPSGQTRVVKADSLSHA